MEGGIGVSSKVELGVLNKFWEEKLFRTHVINWTGAGYANLQKVIAENLEDYRNLDNDDYWRQQMTDEEIEMKRHPNRGFGWMPNRLQEIRNQLRYNLLDIVVGKDNYAKDRIWSNQDCMNCGSSYQMEGQLLRAMTACLATKSDDENEFCPDLEISDYEIARQECWDIMTDIYDIQTTRSYSVDNWSQRSIPMGASRYYGFCNYCWDEVIYPEMLNLLE
jgi:hypothetical protein